MVAKPHWDAREGLGEILAERYRLDAPLGRGGMGAVFRARDLMLGEDIAVKVLTFDPDDVPQLALRFRQEVKLARRVTHPNVARIFDLGEHRGTLFLTMELVDGPSLRELLARERCLPPSRALAIARGVCLGLDAVHAAGVIHRDLKPGNILIAGSGRVVLTDFGIARSVTEESALTTGVIGTPSYMSPEQASGRPIAAHSDLYSFGLVLYEMLRGERWPLGQDEIAASLRAVQAPTPLVTLVQRCVDPNPGARPASALEVERLLADALAALSDGASVATQGVTATGAPAERPAGAVREAVTASSTWRLARERRGLAVLPFRSSGGLGAELGDMFTDEVVDWLSQGRSLRIVGSGATERYRTSRDPQVVGRELGVEAVVDGALSLSGDRVHIAVRLVDAETRAQRWSGHHDVAAGEIHGFLRIVAQRIAEDLRSELITQSYAEDTPIEVVERYRSARQALRGVRQQTVLDAAADFAQCIDLAPTFAPALAGHAIACLRAWLYDRGDSGEPADYFGEAAADSVTRALARAPALAESHLAAGLLALHLGDYVGARRSLLRALSIAPMHVEANEQLGMLECEATLIESGLRRLKLALDIDPSLISPVLFRARYHALRGEHAECHALVELLLQHEAWRSSIATLHAMRLAAWSMDLARLARYARAAPAIDHKEQEMLDLYAQVMLGERETRALEALFAPLSDQRSNLRRRALSRQLLTEAYALQGDLDSAARMLLLASEEILDLAWLRCCPLLSPLRARPELAEAHRKVADRAERFSRT